MKKLFLLTLTYFIVSIGYAQIDNPKLNLQNIRINEKQWHSDNQVIGRENQEPHGERTFDPTWADRFQTVLHNVMSATASKGASMAVYTPEEGMWTGVSGYSHGTVQITTDMRFGIGSNTKLFIAVTMVRLQEEGILSLDDKLHQWLPPYQYVDSSTTIRQLLAHESGIFDYWNDQPSLIDSIWADTSRFWTDEEIIASIGPPHFAPGDGYRYSNTNYVLSGMIMKVATGKSWAENVHEYIIDTLGFESTFIGAVDPRNGPIASEWDYFFGNLIINSPMTAEFSQGNACGSILSTASDMVLWYKALFEGSVISDSSLQLVLSFEPASLFGLGIIAGGEAVQYYYHTGGLLGYISIALYDIRREAIIVILFNDRESNFGYKWNALLSVFFNEYPDLDNDAGIVDIISPWEHYCDSSIIPLVSLRNFGNDPLTSVTINYQVDVGETSEYEWSGTLNTDEIVMVSLPPIIEQEGSHSFTCYTTMPNGEPEGYNFNDTLSSYFHVNIATPLQSGLFEGFDGDGFPKEGWTTNSSSFLQWNETYLARLNGSGSLVKNNSDMSGIFGNYSDLQLPLLNISNLYNTEFSFDYAYAPYPSYYQDSLQVAVSEDCGETWQTLFYAGGYSMRTSSLVYHEFFPQSEDDWEHLSFSLSDFEDDVLIRFRARYGGSNNLFIDNILIGSPVGIDENIHIVREEIPILSYPNPLDQLATIEYQLDHEVYVTLSVYNQFGKIVASLVNEKQVAGPHEVIWNAEGLPAGLYIIRLQAGNNIAFSKLLLAR